MAKGDPSFVLVLAGSAATSIAGNHNLFGAYNTTLGTLNEDESVHIQISASVNEFFLGQGANISNNVGYKIYPSLSTVDLPPMRAGFASQLQMSRAVSNIDASHHFVIWARRP